MLGDTTHHEDSFRHAPSPEQRASETWKHACLIACYGMTDPVAEIARLRECEAQLDATKAQAAQMRDALAEARKRFGEKCEATCMFAEDCEALRAIDSALASPAGKDYVHRSEVEKAYREGQSGVGGYTISRARRVAEGEQV